MSYHGSGIDEQTYDTIRAYMFGQDSLGAWTEEELADKQFFIGWIFSCCDWEEDLPDMDREEVARVASIVFDHELEEWKDSVSEEVDEE